MKVPHRLVLLPGLMDTSITPDPTRHHVTIAIVYMRPFSRGNVHLNSADPLALPRIDPNYLAITDFGMCSILLFVSNIKIADERLCRGRRTT